MTSPQTERSREPLRASVAEEVRALLGRKRMTGQALAEQIGRSQSYVSRRLTGETPFDLDDLERIAKALNCRVSDLLPPEQPGTVTTRKPPVTPSGIRHPADNRPADSQMPGARRPRRISGQLTAPAMMLLGAR